MGGTGDANSSWREPSEDGFAKSSFKGPRPDDLSESQSDILSGMGYADNPIQVAKANNKRNNRVSLAIDLP